MCTPLIAIAGLSAVATFAGSMMQASAQRSVVNAQINAANAANQAQEQGFFQRLQAQNDQQQRDYAAQVSNFDSQAQAQAQLEQQQTAATQQREQQIANANQQTQTLQKQAQDAAAATESQVTPQSLAQAQAQKTQQIEQLASPGTSSIASGTAAGTQGPVAAPVSGNKETASAIASRLAEAASATRDYVTKQATVAGYGAVPQTIAQAGSDLAQREMPLAAAQKEVEAGLPTYLLPSTVAYQSGTNYYQNLLKAIQTRTQGRLNVSQAIASGEITNADLAQADTATAAQNQAAIAAWKAASNPVPGILSGLGSLGAYGAGYLGLGANTTGSVLSSIRNWANTPFIS